MFKLISKEAHTYICFLFYIIRTFETYTSGGLNRDDPSFYPPLDPVSALRKGRVLTRARAGLLPHVSPSVCLPAGYIRI